jgi:hypothetical protein
VAIDPGTAPGLPVRGSTTLRRALVCAPGDLDDGAGHLLKVTRLDLDQGGNSRSAP